MNQRTMTRPELIPSAKSLCRGLVSGHRFSDAASHHAAANVGLATRRRMTLLKSLLVLALLISGWMLWTPSASAQEQSASHPSQQSETKKENSKPPEHKGMAGELVEETREATGEDQEEYSNLKHASVIRRR